MSAFADFLRDKVARLGNGDVAEGTRKAAELGRVTPRTIQLWMRGEGNPNGYTEEGARVKLLRAVHVHERDKHRAAKVAAKV